MLILLTKHRIATGKKDRINADLQHFKHKKNTTGISSGVFK
jgi:hypothetical protein